MAAADLDELRGDASGFRGKAESNNGGKYSCVVLAGQRSMEERRRALQVGCLVFAAWQTSTLLLLQWRCETLLCTQQLGAGNAQHPGRNNSKRLI
jgi:hypothetical protein